jgi:hypothetical protein
MKYEKPMIRTLDSSAVLESMGPASALSSGSDIISGGMSPLSSSGGGANSTLSN